MPASTRWALAGGALGRRALGGGAEPGHAVCSWLASAAQVGEERARRYAASLVADGFDSLAALRAGRLRTVELCGSYGMGAEDASRVVDF